MQSIEVSEKTLPQIRTVFQGLWGIVYGKGKNSPPPLSSPIKGEEIACPEPSRKILPK